MTTSSDNQPESSKEGDKFAIRGGKWLSHEDFRAQLASLIRLENIGVLLGAGASSGILKGKTMKEIWKTFQKECEASCKFLTDKKFLRNDPPNVEKILDSLEIAILDQQRKQNSAKVERLENVRADLLRTVIQGSLLMKAWWENSSATEKDESPLNYHQKLLKKLTTARQPGQAGPWIFTTNYDLAIEWAAESIGIKVINGFDGVHFRTFSSHNFDLGFRNVLSRGEARFGTYNICLAKLHGSLSWQSTDLDIFERPASQMWLELDKFLQKQSNTIPCELINPGSSKYVKTVGFVSGELLRRFTEFMARPQSCLMISGYSFGDEHLNRILHSALENPTLQLVIFAPEAVRCGDKYDSSKCTDWLRRVIKLELPQITIVGCNSNAHFESFVNCLPDPVIYDEYGSQIRKLLIDLFGARDQNKSGDAQ